jgi:hypothetical protein
MLLDVHWLPIENTEYPCEHHYSFFMAHGRAAHTKPKSADHT